jgi:hypothetical protein
MMWRAFQVRKQEGVFLEEIPDACLRKSLLQSKWHHQQHRQVLTLANSIQDSIKWPWKKNILGE